MGACRRINLLIVTQIMVVDLLCQCAGALPPMDRVIARLFRIWS